MLNRMDIFKGYKSYIQLFAMGVLVILDSNGVYVAPDWVYQLLGLGTAATAKMAMDRAARSIGQIPLAGTNKSVKSMIK